MIVCALVLAAVGCAALPPPGDPMIGADAATLVHAYGPPVSKAPAPHGPPGDERIVFVHPARIALGSGLQRELKLCDRLGYAAGVEDLNTNCEDRREWSASGEMMDVSCTLRFTLDSEGKAIAFASEPAGCDAFLTPR
jgi:hypothetical protein